ncbi:LLM class F420-dependent oxidoreductase [Nocardia jiangxiensis]|uniref:LLM class F420-dependent oxidoreductase n=1 Tax=Nocardia jiangxiensis TaxID=282685 RepID=A0ABW6SGE2_9NOCA|nr:LLM class F420-dependent oxidoreductase [Nocardia jiangxiensis]
MTIENLGKVGVWAYPSMVTPESAAELERLGYRALWLGNPGAELDLVRPLLAATEHLVVGSYIVNVWAVPATTAAEAFHRIEAEFPGRFLLGVGAGHREINTDYRSPYRATVDYFDQLDDLGVPRERRALAALGPRMLDLARERSAGALPYLITPDYIRAARGRLGADALLAAEQKFVLDQDPDRARAEGRKRLAGYLGLSNYTTNLRRIGFTDEDLALPGSDRVVDALALHGDVDQVVTGLRAHLDAGADHVVAQALTADGDLMPALRALAAGIVRDLPART